MNKIFNKIAMILPMCSVMFNTGCTKRNYNYDNFFGMCEVCGELSNGVDYALTNDAIASKAKIMGVKSFRIWISVKDLFNVDEDDNITIKSSYFDVMYEHVSKLYDAGVRNFLFMYTTFIYPKDYVPSTGYVVPDPVTEYDTYIRFLNLMGKAAAAMVEAFPQCTIVEPGNEPDFQNASCVHKNGYIFGGVQSVNSSYLFTDDEKASILDDVCWYVRKYLNESKRPEVKVAIPGLTNLETAPDFLDLMYDRIKSKELPAGQKYSDTNVDHYFDYLNWHPYTWSNKGNIDSDWLDYQNEMYQAAIDHGDDGRPVIFSEFGQTDFGELSIQDHIADIYTDCFKTVRKKLPMVESVYCFRMFNLVHQDVSLGENNFGLFYNPDDVESRACKAKPAAIAIAKYFNGDNFDVSLLDKYAK